MDKISAGELRAAGYDIAEKIPDCAVIPRWAIRMKAGKARAEGDVLKMDLEVSFLMPFTWVTIDIDWKLQY